MLPTFVPEAAAGSFLVASFTVELLDTRRVFFVKASWLPSATDTDWSRAVVLCAVHVVQDYKWLRPCANEARVLAMGRRAQAVRTISDPCVEVYCFRTAFQQSFVRSRSKLGLAVPAQLVSIQASACDFLFPCVEDRWGARSVFRALRFMMYICTYVGKACSTPS